MRNKANAIAAMMEAKRSYSEVMEAVRNQIDGMQKPIKEKIEYVKFLINGIRDNILFNGSVWDAPTSDISYTRAIIMGLEEINEELLNNPKQRQISSRKEAFDCIKSLGSIMRDHLSYFDLCIETKEINVEILFYMCYDIYVMNPKGIADFISEKEDRKLYDLFVALDEDAKKIIDKTARLNITQIKAGEKTVGMNYYSNICAIRANIRNMKEYFSTVLGEASDSQNGTKETPQRLSNSENENQPCYDSITQQKPTEAVNSMSSESNDTPQQHSKAEDDGKASTTESPTSVKKETSSMGIKTFSDVIKPKSLTGFDKSEVLNMIKEKIGSERGIKAANIITKAYYDGWLTRLPTKTELRALIEDENKWRGISEYLKENNSDDLRRHDRSKYYDIMGIDFPLRIRFGKRKI